MNSALYFGTVRHRRRSPVVHEFSYRVFQVYLDLDELDHVFQGRLLWSTKGANVAWFRRTDHVGDPRMPLRDAVSELVERRTGRRPRGPIRLLTHLRYFGYCMNPVSFYYCFDLSGDQGGDDRGRSPQHALGGAPLLRAAGGAQPGLGGQEAVPLREGVPRLAIHGHGPGLCVEIQPAG